MKLLIISSFSILVIFNACIQSQPAPLQDAKTEPTGSPTQRATVPTEDLNNNLLELPTPITGTVALNFSEDPCSASWSNNGEYLPCPGETNTITNGYVDMFEQIIIEGSMQIKQQGLLTIPAQTESGYYGIFGKYPPFTVHSGDHFRSVLACVDDHPACDVDFSLEYFNSDNTVSQVAGAKWNKKYTSDGSYVYADVKLDSLAGRTIQFLLTVRDNGSAHDDYAVWINPHIARPSAGTDAVSPIQFSDPSVKLVNISGVVDMRSAPPYLYDDQPPGSRSAVVLFDVNSDLFYYAFTQSDDLSFSLKVIPGQYYLTAYAYGVGDVPYVTGAYTGIDPSCGQQTAILNILPDKPVTNVIINDWNWSCGGTAERIEKPEEVTLPFHD